jgi:hypothetical protein
MGERAHFTEEQQVRQFVAKVRRNAAKDQKMR